MVRAQAYRILGVDRNADRTEIKKRYRQLMHMAHPDSNAAKQQEVIRILLRRLMRHTKSFADM